MGPAVLQPRQQPKLMSRFRNAALYGGGAVHSINFCRAISRSARLLYPTKLSRRQFAIEAVTGH
jgi:hypothetical protein